MHSAWSIEYEPRAQKQLKKLDRTGDPRGFGEAMIGNWSGFWRYRIGDYRAIAKIEDERVTIFIIEVAHRREVYR